MRVNILCDIYWESRVDWVTHALSDAGYRNFFDEQDYGSSINNLVIIMMCRDSYLNFKQRIRFSKKEKTLYMDIMLDLDQFMKIAQKEREEIVVDKLISEVPLIIAKYKFKDFNLLAFEKDFKIQMSKIL
ncbi:hypothetical protein [Flavobacterium sp. AG291]|uniref:hypothetical protein n=1 Tax=Flavobacterium sp. AG291 TaxID=2184000 RepID=UPI000E0C1E4D|nr:hypothetical protein [Flavobacterium sp. AG291]RDI13194.1 hypothetical protein DEU42_103104 [Flavobacterium sp. AG291]